MAMTMQPTITQITANQLDVRSSSILLKMVEEIKTLILSLYILSIGSRKTPRIARTIEKQNQDDFMTCQIKFFSPICLMK